jgi:hypothetical protein
MVTELRVWLTAALVVFALLAVVSFFIVVGMFAGEYWCGYEEWHRRSP